MATKRPNFNKAVRELLEDVATSMEEFRHIQPARVLVVAGEARRASRGTVKPLAFEGSRLTDALGRRKPSVRVDGKRMLYCITLRPLFFRNSTAQARITTLLHELFHISPKFDGTLEGTRRHARMGKDFDRQFRPIVRKYLRRCPAELKAQFALDGEVKVLQWLERPSAWFEAGDSVRAKFTEEQLFWGVVRMVSSGSRVADEGAGQVH